MVLFSRLRRYCSIAPYWIRFNFLRTWIRHNCNSSMFSISCIGVLIFCLRSPLRKFFCVSSFRWKVIWLLRGSSPVSIRVKLNFFMCVTFENWFWKLTVQGSQTSYIYLYFLYSSILWKISYILLYFLVKIIDHILKYIMTFFDSGGRTWVSGKMRKGPNNLIKIVENCMIIIRFLWKGPYIC